jgi:Asp-tRNA(Asn)/Glu-tRNA(Gln) amidotransferase A subunit family amidase
MKLIPFIISVSRITIYCLLLTSSASATSAPSQKTTEFSFIETTINDIHVAIKDQIIDCETITSGFLNRIKKYDEISNLNSIIYLNPNAIKKAKALDKKYQKTKTMHSLHCVPILLKDNFDTADMPTEAGSIALSGSIPPDDAYDLSRVPAGSSGGTASAEEQVKNQRNINDLFTLQIRI